MRRQAILDAALECFTTLGFSQTGMEDIRTRAEASTGSLYYHFKSKEQLAAELFLEALKRYHAALRRDLEGKTSAEAGIRALVDAHTRWSQDNPWATYLAQSSEVCYCPETAKECQLLMQRAAAEIAAWLDPFVESGEVVRLPEEAYLPIVLGPAQAAFGLSVYGDMRRLGPNVQSDVLGDAAWRALRVAAPAA